MQVSQCCTTKAHIDKSLLLQNAEVQKVHRRNDVATKENSQEGGHPYSKE
jgi:hypothetical protein